MSDSAVLLDTCAVIFLAEGLPLAPGVMEQLLRAAENGGVFVSPVSAWEIGLLSRPGRGGLSVAPDPKTWFARVMASAGIRSAPFTPDIAIDSSHLPPPLHGDPADRLLIATARSMGLPLVTRDKPILAYAVAGHVQAIPC